MTCTSKGTSYLSRAALADGVVTSLVTVMLVAPFSPVFPAGSSCPALLMSAVRSWTRLASALAYSFFGSFSMT